MTTIQKILTILSLFYALSCNTPPVPNTTPLIAKDTTNANEKKNTLLVFVGEKISIEKIPSKKGDFDNSFTANYKIIQRVYGNYPKDIITFKVYDHYGTPAFAKYSNVLMFVSEYEGRYYQEKYMFNDVYRTKDGRWAGSYAIDDYGHDYNKGTPVKPVKLEFAEEVSYPTKMKYEDGTEFSRSFPEPYFKTVGDKAIAIYGNYIEDLFKLKKDGYLTARELFGVEKPVKDVPLEDIKNTAPEKKQSAH